MFCCNVKCEATIYADTSSVYFGSEMSDENWKSAPCACHAEEKDNGKHGDVHLGDFKQSEVLRGFYVLKTVFLLKVFDLYTICEIKEN